MRPSEKVAFQYLQERGYQPKDIDFNTARVVDFVCSDGKKFEVKSLQHKRTLLFTPNQWNHFNKSKINIIVVYKSQVRDVFPFEEALTRGYKTSILGKQEGGKSVKVSDEAHCELVAIAAYLTMETRKKKTIADAVEHLLEYKRREIEK